MRINLGAYKPTSGSRFITEDGWYDCKIPFAEFQEVKGRQVVKVLFSEVSTGASVSAQYYLDDERSVGRLRHLADTVGLTEESIRNFTATMLVGGRCGIHCKKNRKNPKYMNVWDVCNHEELRSEAPRAEAEGQSGFPWENQQATPGVDAPAAATGSGL